MFLKKRSLLITWPCQGSLSEVRRPGSSVGWRYEDRITSRNASAARLRSPVFLNASRT